jgi:hypothetical protein
MLFAAPQHECLLIARMPATQAFFAVQQNTPVQRRVSLQPGQASGDRARDGGAAMQRK